MNMKAILFLFCAAFAFCATAQQPVLIPLRSLPPAELQVQAPRYCRVVVTCHYPTHPDGKTAPNDNRPEKIVAIKTGTVISQITTAICGRRSESWMIGKLQLNRNQEGSELLESRDDKNDPEYVPMQTGDFPEFSWIGPRNYLGSREWMGRTVLVFGTVKSCDPSSSFPRDNLNLSGLDMLGGTIAFIDSVTRLPVLLQTEQEMRIYQFTLLLPVDQKVPEDVRASVDKRNIRIERMLAPPARPF